MGLEFAVHGEGDDDSYTTTGQELAQQFLKAGAKNASVTPDGTTIHVSDNQGGVRELDIKQLLEAQGNQVGFKPLDEAVDYSTVDPSYARKLELIGNDETSRQLLLKSQLAGKGIPDAKIVGSGDDYFYFDPKTNKYNALTNKPGMDMSDIQRSIPGLVSGAGALAGGLFGAAGGGGLASIPAGALGAAGGGMFARNLMKSAESAGDPEYRKILDQQTDTDGVNANIQKLFSSPGKGTDQNLQGLSPEAQRYMSEEAMHTGVDALAGGIGAVPLKGVQATLNNGLVSRSVQGAGKLAEVGGGVVKKGADYLAGEGAIPELARGLMAQASPLGPIQNAAYLARAGELIPMASRGAAKVTERAGQFLDNNALNASLRGASEESLASAGTRDKIFSTAEKLRARNLAPEAEESLAQSTGRKYDNFFANKAGEATKGKPIAGVDQANIEQTIANYARGNGAEGSLNKLGKGLQTASDLGKATEQGIDRVVRGGINTVGNAANVIGKGGKYANRVARFTAPLENRALLQYGNEEIPEYYRKRK